MRLLPAFFIVAAFVTTGPAAWSAPIKLKLPHLVKTEEKICERKPDGVYCGRGIKRKHLFRCVAGHFKPDHHFGFEAVSWYWHFVDVVWLLLFIFVYWV